ncbi:MAG: hypothetical protein QG640_618 [Patescibacteria group bacterium]|nr:hypothetical protein [Candidatus Saccharibacteria bacterium]MDQ5893606.1 hypothetical protein [Patescibacteria group bacterium]MDQ5963108.1 hypothetical protein [Patescibacteria group bacterium]
MKRTSPDKEREVLTSILMGDTYSEVSQKTNVPVSTIKKIKKRNDAAIAQSYTKHADEQADSAKELLQKTNKRIARLLALDGMGAINISVADLCRISEAMHAQTLVDSSPLKSAQTLTRITQKYR